MKALSYHISKMTEKKKGRPHAGGHLCTAHKISNVYYQRSEILQQNKQLILISCSILNYESNSD